MEYCFDVTNVVVVVIGALQVPTNIDAYEHPVQTALADKTCFELFIIASTVYLCAKGTNFILTLTLINAQNQHRTFDLIATENREAISYAIVCAAVY